MLVESGPEVYEFKHIDPESDLLLVHAITLNRACITDRWLCELDQFMDDGSAPIDPWGTTVKEKEAVNDARREYERRLGLHNPAHPLHSAYASVTADRPNGLIPSQMFGSLRELANIAGDAEQAVDMARRQAYLLAINDRNLRIHYAYVERLAARFGWRGDVNKLAQEEPIVLVVSAKKAAAVGWIAVEHASSAQQAMDNKVVARLVKNTPVEAHLKAIIQRGDSYVFGQREDSHRGEPGSRLVSNQREVIYEALGSPHIVKRIGYEVVKAYFRHRPPSIAVQKKYPYLQAFLPLALRAPLERRISNKEIPIAVTGEESWLTEVNIPIGTSKRKAWLTNLNRRIARGSISLADYVPGNPYYEEVVNERILFFRLFGWSAKNHELQATFTKFSLNQESLVLPQRVVDIMNLFTEYNVKPITPVLAAYFRVFLYALETVRTKLDVIGDEGFEANEVLQGAGSILSYGETKMRQVLRRRKQKLEARLR